MNNPKVSVIVPIYNVEKYLNKCLKTIKSQTFKDFEVLLINDGTKDNSAVTAQKYCDTDKRSKPYNKENAGLSDSRNYGLKLAKGEYIVFIDADDYIHKDYLYVLYHECVDNGADMSYCRFKYSYFNTGITFPMFISAKEEVMKAPDALNILIRDNFLHSYAWNKMYKKSLFDDNNITYPDMYFEDVATSGRLLFHANKIAVSDRYLYYYLKRFGSIMSTMNAKKINDFLRSALFIRNYVQLKGHYDEYKDSIYKFARKVHLVNIYSIIRQHLVHFDFRKMGYNFKMNKAAFNYIISDDYVPTEDFPDIPYKLVQPGWKKDKKKK